MTTKNLNIMYAKDLMLSLANKLPVNLMLDAINDYGIFSADFLLRLTDEQLLTLNKAAQKHGNKNVFMSFATTKSSSSCPVEMKNYSNFDWNKVSKITISDMAPYLQNTVSEPLHFVSVVFLLKD